MKTPTYDLIVIGGGAAGFFGALSFAHHSSGTPPILILEKGREFLSKVKISGGGRCNVTHACFDPQDLVTYYPRGYRELLGPFNKFGPADTIEWFENRGVALKTEADGRMFPTTNDSETIVDCLLGEARKARIDIRCQSGAKSLVPPEREGGYWQVVVKDGEVFKAPTVLIASGSSKGMWDMLGRIGLTIVPPVPSLFTFQIADSRIQGLQGLSVPHAQLEISEIGLSESGPLLITHWGLSGPAVLKLSARGARELHQMKYRFNLSINWIGNQVRQEVAEQLNGCKLRAGGKSVGKQTLWPGLPSRLWIRMIQAAGIDANDRWADLSKVQLAALVGQLTTGTFSVAGKSTFKEEFVTAGGVDLAEIDFRRFEVKHHPGLFIAGEALNIDALTGGFNFQAAWTGGFLAGKAAAERLSEQD